MGGGGVVGGGGASLEPEISRLEATETAQGPQLVCVSCESSDSSRHLRKVKDSRQSSQCTSRREVARCSFSSSLRGGGVGWDLVGGLRVIAEDSSGLYSGSDSLELFCPQRRNKKSKTKNQSGPSYISMTLRLVLVLKVAAE